MNRSAINQALSKSLAYRNAGKQDAANYWAGVLVQLLANEGIEPNYVTASQVDASSRSSEWIEGKDVHRKPIHGNLPNERRVIRQSFDSFFQSN